MPKKRENPSYRDIAKAAGVSLMSVSLALRGTGRVSEATRVKIRRIADQMGYSADPKIAEMMGYIRRRRIAFDRPVLAMINAREAPLARLNRPYVVGIAKVAAATAEKLGYRLEEFWLNEAGMTDSRLSRILEARGIRGVLLLPLPPGRTDIRFRWPLFTGISTCHLSTPMGLNQVVANRQEYVELALEKLADLPYRRIGLAIDEDMDVRSGHQTIAHVLWYQSRRPKQERVKPLLAPALDVPSIKRWIEAERPDVVISPRNHVIEMIREAGFRVPQQIGFLSLAASADPGHLLTGIDERPAHVGDAAIRLLTAQLQRGEFGLPDFRQVMLIKPAWIDGRTLRRGRTALP